LLGKTAAEHFNGHVLTGGVVGVSGGMALASMVSSLNNLSNIENLSVYSMSIWCRSRIDSVSPVAVVSDLIKNYPGSKGFSAQLPGYSSDPKVAYQQKQMDLERIKPVLGRSFEKRSKTRLYMSVWAVFPRYSRNDQTDFKERAQ